MLSLISAWLAEWAATEEAERRLVTRSIASSTATNPSHFSGCFGSFLNAKYSCSLASIESSLAARTKLDQTRYP